MREMEGGRGSDRWKRRCSRDAGGELAVVMVVVMASERWCGLCPCVKDGPRPAGLSSSLTAFLEMVSLVQWFTGSSTEYEPLGWSMGYWLRATGYGRGAFSVRLSGL